MTKMTMTIKTEKVSNEALTLGLIAAERAITSLKKKLIALARSADSNDKIDLWCSEEFHNDPNINMNYWAKGITKEEFDQFNSQGLAPITDSEWQIIRGEVKFIRMKKLAWANYLLAHILPHSKAYRTVKLRNNQNYS